MFIPGLKTSLKGKLQLSPFLICTQYPPQHKWVSLFSGWIIHLSLRTSRKYFHLIQLLSHHHTHFIKNIWHLWQILVSRNILLILFSSHHSQLEIDFLIHPFIFHRFHAGSPFYFSTKCSGGDQPCPLTRFQL